MRAPDLAGKVAVMTGASQGIGLAIARGLARAGARTVLSSSSAERLASAVAALQADGIDVDGRVADLAQLEQIEALHRFARDRYGAVDILVNSAATRLHGAALDITPEEWDRLMGVNLRGLFFACQCFGRAMVARRQGKILNVSSVLAFRAAPRRAPYAASKAGVSALTRCLALEWAAANVQVNALAPGLVLSPPVVAARDRDPEALERLVGRIPAGRAAAPSELAALSVFLCSAEADYITGQTYTVDGGLTLA